MTWPKVPLEDLCEIVVGRTPSRSNPSFWGDGHVWVSIADLGKSREVRQSKEKISDAGAQLLKGRLAAAGTVLLSFKLSIGKVGIAAVPVFTNEAIAALPIKPGASILPEYLARYLESIDLSIYTNRAAMGQTLNLPILKAIPIPLPPLPEQRRIASILDQADALRLAARESSFRVEAIRSAVFVFDVGPIETAPRFAIKKLGTVSALASGSTPDRRSPEYFGGSSPWVKTTEVRGAVIKKTSEQVTEAGRRAARLRLFPKGSLVVAMYGQGKTRGQVATLGMDATVNQACAVIMPNSLIDNEFLFEQLKMSYERLRAKARGGNQANLNLALVADLDVLVPELGQQRAFSAKNRVLTRVAELNSHRSHLLDELFASLQHQAFEGTL